MYGRLHEATEEDERAAARGEYALTSEAEREALRDWVRNRDRDQRDLETLQDAIETGIGSGSGIPADQVFTELRARYFDKC